MKRREFLTRSLGFATGAVGLAATTPAVGAMASPAQGHRILDLELFDTVRQRPVPSRLYLPQQARPEHPVPLIVFSHGLGGSRKVCKRTSLLHDPNDKRTIHARRTLTSSLLNGTRPPQWSPVSCV